MASFTLKSTIIALTLALTATADPQCTTNADCLPDFICGISAEAGGDPAVNVCVQLGTCVTGSDGPNLGPKCGDSMFCNRNGYCGSGYVNMAGGHAGVLVCVDQATGVQCAQKST